MDVLELKTFCVIVEQGTVRAAAKALHLSQPAISARIAKLEAELGYELFLRHGRTVALSRNGEKLLPYAWKIQNLVQEANENLKVLKDEEHLVLVIASSSRIATYLLPSLLQKFKQKYPKIAVTMRTASDPIGALDTAGVDVALGSRVKGKGVRKMPLLIDTLVPVCSPSFAQSSKYKLAGKLTLNDIAGDVINFTRDRGFYGPLRKLLRQTKGHWEQRITVDNIEAMKRMAACDVGIAFLPHAVVAQELAEGSLLEVPLQYKPVTRETFLVYRPKRYMNPAIKYFVGIAEIWRNDMQRHLVAVPSHVAQAPAPGKRLRTGS
jgi:DNA-binding transcriptional LysR family regulator